MSEYAGTGNISLLDQFIGLLSRELAPLAPHERDKIVAQYTKHFKECKACDMSDDEILARIGDPVSLGRAYAAGSGASYAPGKEYGEKVYRSAPGMIGMAILLGFISVFFVYPILIPVSIAMIAGVVSAAAGVAASAIGLLSVFIPPLQAIVTMAKYPPAANILICIGCGSACILLTMMFKSLSRSFIRLTGRYTGWVVRKVKGY